jgi:hypothetical protein
MGTDPKVVLVIAAISLMLIGAKTVAHGVVVGAKKTGHVIVRIVKHPVHSAKNGAIHEPAPKQ